MADQTYEKSLEERIRQLEIDAVNAGAIIKRLISIAAGRYLRPEEATEWLCYMYEELPEE